MKKLVIYGAGGLGLEVKSMLAGLTESYKLIGFLDDAVGAGQEIEGAPVLGGVEWLKANALLAEVVVAIGNPAIKQKVVQQINGFKNIRYATLIHARAVVQNLATVKIGIGSILGAGSVLTTAIELGNHVLINLNATVGHGTIIGDFSSIMPGVNLAGNVSIGAGVLVGSGANILNGKQVGVNAIIGAGSVVNHDVAANATAVGVPARVIKRI